MEFRILGPVEAHSEHGALTLGGVKPRALVAVLLLHANESVSAERLAVALWGPDAPASAVKRIQVHVSRLRKALGGSEILSTTAAGYRLRVLPGELDAERFAQLVEVGRIALAAGQAERAAAKLREALALSRGPPLADVAFEPFAPAEIARLEEQRLAALEVRVAADLCLRRHAKVVGELRQLVSDNPTREALVGQLMLSLYRCGRQRDALDVYARTHAYLRGELGLEPGTALKAMQRAILEQAPSMDLPASEATVGPSPAESPFSLPPALVAAADTFVGRAADLSALADVYAEALQGAHRIVLVYGEPGIGKTRLAAQFAQRAFADGAIVLYGRCDEEGLLAQQPFAEALRQYVRACPADELAGRLQLVSGELRRIVPELAERVPELPHPLSGDPEGARSRLFEAVCSLLTRAAQHTPVVLVLDDLQWADRSTLLLLKYLARYSLQARLMVLGTYRQTDLDVDHPLSAVLVELRRERRLDSHELEPLDAAAVSQLVDIHVGDAASPELRRIVYEGTEGNAFFVVEVLRHLAETGAIWSEDDGTAGLRVGGVAVPETVKGVIAQRVRRLGPSTARLLATASVLGHEFELDVLQDLGAPPEDELLDGLEAAVRAHVIEELPGATGRYRFSHALIRDTLYDTLTPTRRVVMHRRAGSAIEEVHRDDLAPYLGELARHFANAGTTSELERAIEYGVRAGEHATVQLSYEQAAAHYRRTAELIDAVDPARLQRRRCDLVIAQGEAERQAGDPAYRRTLLEGARLARQMHDPERLARAALANNRGTISSTQGVDRERASVLRAALDAYDGADSPTRAALLALLAVETVTDAPLRDRLSRDALAMARRIGDPRTLALVLTRRCAWHWVPAEAIAEREANLREAEELADRLDDPLVIGHVAFHGAHNALNFGDLDECDRLVGRLRVVAEQLAQPCLRWYEMLVRAKRAVICGSGDEAEQLAYAALELGRRGGQPDAELFFLGQLVAARFVQGTLDRRDPYLPDLVPTPGASLPPGRGFVSYPSMPLLVNAAMSAILCELGRIEDARGHFEFVMRAGLDDLPPDYMGHAIPVYASIACAGLGDARRAARLHELLEPHRDRIVNTGAGWFGTTAHYLGVLAATMERPDEAQAHFAAAARTYESLNAKPWLARLSKDRSAALLTRPILGG